MMERDSAAVSTRSSSGFNTGGPMEGFLLRFLACCLDREDHDGTQDGEEVELDGRTAAWRRRRTERAGTGVMATAGGGARAQGQPHEDEGD
jgi:hypothetical protein